MVKMLKSNDLEWRSGVPYAPAFGDFYYASENGLAETEYVFLDGIGAPSIWLEREHFIIGETGFGTGLNFLCTYKKWLESGAKGRLTFISAEKHPLSEAALAQAHALFPELKSMAQMLRSAWPPPSSGFHPRYFENGKIQLLLLFGDAATVFTELDAQVDAWFLDGFSPAKNQELWSEQLFDQIARLSKPDAQFATFTAAGFVRRALEARGFNIQKTDGFGHKRNRLIGQMCGAHKPAQQQEKPEWSALGASNGGPITIIGAGIAGRSLAAALKRRGHTATVFGGKQLPTASQVPAAILAPAFQAGPQPTTDFVTSSFAHACWLPAYGAAWASQRGTETLAVTINEKIRFKRIYEALGWGSDWVDFTEKGLHFPRSGSLDTTAALSSAFNTETIKPTTVRKIEKTSAGWLLSGDEFRHETATLVLATGAGTSGLLTDANNIGFTARAGQIETLSTGSKLPSHSVASSGYITAPIAGKHTLGSTFTEYSGDAQENPAATTAATAEILDKLEAEFNMNINQQALQDPWTGIRAATVDYMPVIGPVPDWDVAAATFAPLSKDRKLTGLGSMKYQEGLFLLAGFGSKGFQQAPYAAEYLAAHICGDPLPMAASMAAYLHPARNFIRKIIRSGRRP